MSECFGGESRHRQEGKKHYFRLANRAHAYTAVERRWTEEGTIKPKNETLVDCPEDDGVR